MLQQKFDIAGVSFALVRNGESRFKGYLREKDLLPCTDPGRRTFDGIGFDEYVAKWAEELERIAESFVQGIAAVDPKIPPGRTNSSCEHCHLMALCRVSDVASDDFDGEGESDE